MTKRTKKQWQDIMQTHAEYTGTTKQFCAQQKIPLQTFYSRRHAMGLSVPMQSKKSIVTNPPAGQFVKAQVSRQSSTVILQTQYAQLSLSTQCDPNWLATLLKGLGA